MSTTQPQPNGVDSMAVADQRWTPSSWRTKPISQEVIYDDKIAFEQAISKLNRLPPLVTPQEIVELKQHLRDAAQGNAFLLQGGDCAELFEYCNQESIESKIKLLLQMSLVLTHGLRKKIVRVARMAGQYAKPRSSPNEIVNGVTMPSFRGDILNSFEPDLKARQPNPDRLVEAYFHSSTTLLCLKAALGSGLGDMHTPLDWSLGHVSDPELRERYQSVVKRVTDFLDMTRAIGVDTGSGLRTVDMYSSHEGLLLEYETALTRLCKHPTGTTKRSSHLASTPQSGYYNTSAHFIWIGDRTRQLTHAHIEYFRGISNPIGVKVGPSMPPSDLVPLLDILNPSHELGKIVLITRYGADKIASLLPAHIRAVQSSSHAGTVVWQCDPMHGNGRNATITVTAPAQTNNNITPEPAPSSTSSPPTTTFKTRRFTDILSELEQALQIHRENNSYLGGVHLELTGEAVTECVGGAEGLTEQDLPLNYTTYCDPRLNEKQALELAFLVAGFYREAAEKEESGV